jgi:hypothetical protein
MSDGRSDSSTSYSNSPPEIEASRPFFARPLLPYEGCNTAENLMFSTCLIFLAIRGPPRRQPVRRMAGEPKPERQRKRKQKTATPPGAARPSSGRQTKQCPRETGRNMRTAFEEIESARNKLQRNAEGNRASRDRRKLHIPGARDRCSGLRAGRDLSD